MMDFTRWMMLAVNVLQVTAAVRTTAQYNETAETISANQQPRGVVGHVYVTRGLQWTGECKLYTVELETCVDLTKASPGLLDSNDQIGSFGPDEGGICEIYS
jgi:hypothetical protein